MKIRPDQKRVLVRYGGGYRKYLRQTSAFEQRRIPLKDVGRFTLGSKYELGIIPNTPNALKLACNVGMTIAREQWGHL